jgi:hypothetical protein
VLITMVRLPSRRPTSSPAEWARWLLNIEAGTPCSTLITSMVIPDAVCHSSGAVQLQNGAAVTLHRPHRITCVD